MRDLSPALLAACSVPGGLPAARLELADVWPHLATVATGSNGGPCAGAVAADGALVTAALRALPGGTVVGVVRVVDPADAGAWSGWQTLESDPRPQAGVCLCAAGGTLRALWQASSSTALRYADSIDGGQLWGAPATLLDPGHPLYGIAADGDLGTVLLAYDPGTLGYVRVAVWALQPGPPAAWVGSDWSNGDQNTIAGLAAARVPPGLAAPAGSYALALALQGAGGEVYSIQSCLYTPGVGWSALSLVAPVDTATGLSLRAPHLAFWDGAFRLSYGVADSGADGAGPYARLARTSSLDFVYWQAPLEDPGEPAAGGFPNGAAWLRHARGQALVAAEAVRWAPAYDPATGYRDLSADLLRLELREAEGVPARLIATLDDSRGQYAGLPILRPDAQLLFSLGIAGAGFVPAHLLYLDGWTVARAAGEATLTLVASDRSRFLERQSRVPLAYMGRTPAQIVADLAAHAGCDGLVVDTTASALAAQVLPSFQVVAGERYRVALDRALAIYDLALQVRSVPAAAPAPAFVVSEQPRLLAREAGQPPVWHYGAEPFSLQIAQEGARANHLLVFGAASAPGVFAEIWDWADVTASGQERFAQIVEGFADNAATAALVASQALAREARLATRVELTVAPHPGLELFDALTVADATPGTVVVRIIAHQLTLHPLEGRYESRYTCEGR